MKIEIDGLPVPNPHFSTIKLESRSRADIPSSAFDGSKPIIFSVSYEGSFLHINQQSSGIVADESTIVSAGRHEYRIAPQLLRPGAATTITFVTTDRPVITVQEHLIDISVISENVNRRRSKKWSRLVDNLMIGFLVILGALVVTGLIVNLVRVFV